MPITSLSEWRQIRSRGTASTPQQTPTGYGGVLLNSGQMRFDVTAGDPGTERGVMRSEIAGNPLPRYGRHGLRVTFMVPAFWAQDSGVFCLTAVPDPDDAVIHNSPLAVCIKGDRLRIAKRSDPNPASPPSITPVTLGERQLVAGRWHTLDLDMNLSWLGDGCLHASLDGKTLADDHGANCYNDQVPPFWCAGLYWWRSEGDPMALRVGEWART